MGAFVRRRAAGIASLVLVAILAGCESPIPETSPLTSITAGTWVSLDGRYRITLDEAPNTMQITLPIENFGEHGGSCSTTGDYPPAVTISGTWTYWENIDELNLLYGNVNYGVGPAREGDWSVIEDYPCGPDFDPLYLVRADSTLESD